MSSTVVAVDIKYLLHLFGAATTFFLHNRFSLRADAGALVAPLSNNSQPFCHLVDPSCLQALKRWVGAPGSGGPTRAPVLHRATISGLPAGDDPGVLVQHRNDPIC